MRPRLGGLAMATLAWVREGDPTGVGWVGRYARLLRTRLGVRADVSNLAQSGSPVSTLLADLRGTRRGS